MFISKSTALSFSAFFLSAVYSAASHSQVLSKHTIADALSSPAVYIDMGKKGDSIGDQYVFDQPLLDNKENIIGSNSGVCIRTRVNHSLQCQWTLTMATGTIQVAGREFDRGESSIVIVGGTGFYRGVSGIMRSAKDASGRFNQYLSYQLP